MIGLTETLLITFVTLLFIGSLYYDYLNKFKKINDNINTEKITNFSEEICKIYIFQAIGFFIIIFFYNNFIINYFELLFSIITLEFIILNNISNIFFKLKILTETGIIGLIIIFFKKIYNGILLVILLTIVVNLFYSYFFIFDGTNYLNFLKDFGNNSFLLVLIISTLLFIIIGNLGNFIKIIFKYIITFKTILFLFLLYLTIHFSNIIYLKNSYIFQLKIIGKIIALIFIFIIFKNIIKLFLKEKGNYNLYNIFYKSTYTSDKKIHYKKYLEKLKKGFPKSNPIKPLSDEPIGLLKDIFGFSDFSKNIFDILNGIEFDDGKNNGFQNSFSIGIVGEWGGGKSSIINLLNEEYLEGNPNFIVHKFNPWNYDKNNLLERFFGDLSKVLGERDISKNLKSYLNLIGNIDNKAKILTDFLGTFIGIKTSEEIKKDINNKLKNNGKKIIIIIDDLDRCEPDEVIIMLNLIKNLGDFSNIIYLVSYDKKHITDILVEKKFGAEYIDKIINIENFIPKPGIEQLKKYFEIEFGKILKKYDENISFFDNKTEEIFKNIESYNEENNKDKTVLEEIVIDFEEIFKKENLRFIKKLLNKLNIIFSLNIKKETYLEYLEIKKIILINYIKLKDYNWYKFIIEKKNILELGLEERNLIYKGEKRPKELLNLKEGFLYKNDFIFLLDFRIEYKEDNILLFNTNYLSNSIILFKGLNNIKKIDLNFIKKYS